MYVILSSQQHTFPEISCLVNRNWCSEVTAVLFLHQLKIIYCIIYVPFLDVKVVQTKSNQPVIFHILNIQHFISTTIFWKKNPHILNKNEGR